MKFGCKSPEIYQFCSIEDGLLYTEVPNFYPHPEQARGDLLTLLLNQRWRGGPHFRTSSGYVPYSGGGIAFKALPLVLRGVKPLWWPAPGVTTEIAEKTILVETPYYKNERQVEKYREKAGYHKECEWLGWPGMHFLPEDIQYIWIGYSSLRKHPAEKLVSELRTFIPENIPILLEPPEKTPYPFKRIY